MGGRIMASTINADTSNGVIITPDTSGEIELQANGVTKAKVTANGLQDANGNSLRGGMYRNLIINGDMQIAQRGTSISGITGSGFHTIDRFYTTLSSLGTWTHTQSTDVPSGQGFASSYKMECTTADASPAASDYKIWSHKIEAQMLQHLKFGTSSAEKLTVSFWVKSNKTATYILEFQQPDADRISSNAFTINSADTWEKKTITIDGDTSGTINNDNGSGLELNFWFGAGTTFTSGTLSSAWAAKVSANRCVGISNLADSTSNYINITGVQLEVGEGASDFEFLPYDVQLQRCQRYYVKWLVPVNTGGGATTWATAVSTTIADGYIFLPTTMRTASLSLTVNSLQYYISTTSGTGSSGTWSLAYTTNDKVKVIRYTHGSGVFTAGTAIAFTGNGASGYLALSGEL